MHLLGHVTVLTVRKNLTVGYLLLTVISFWILLSATAILLMPFGYLFLRNGYLFLRKSYLKYLHFPCCIFAYKEKGPVLCPVCGHFLCWNAWEQPWLMSLAPTNGAIRCQGERKYKPPGGKNKPQVGKKGRFAMTTRKCL